MQLRAVDTDFDIRSDGGNGNTLVGHAAIFNSPTVIAGMFREQIAPRAFRKSIKESDVRALFNHNTDIVLGRNKSGTLRLKEDDVGLSYEIDLPDTQAARDLWTLIDRGDVSGSSFAFETVKEARDNPESGSTDLPMVTIREAKLYDISPCTMPSYEDTDVSARVFLRVADLSGHSVEEVRAAWEADDAPRLWTPQSTIADPAPDARAADLESAEPSEAPTSEPQDATAEPPDEALASRNAALNRRDSALREIDLLEIELS